MRNFGRFDSELWYIIHRRTLLISRAVTLEDTSPTDISAGGIFYLKGVIICSGSGMNPIRKVYPPSIKMV